MISFRCLFYTTVCILIFEACSPKITYQPFDALETPSAALPKDWRTPCANPLNYLPDTLHPEFNKMRTIRVNFHYLDDSTRMNNFTEKNAPQYFKNMLYNAYERWLKPHKMALPEGNNTPAYPVMLQYKIWPSKGFEASEGHYFHVDSELAFFIQDGKYQNNYDRKVVDKYAIGSDSILQFWILPHPTDPVRRNSFVPHNSGIALGTSIKLGGIYQKKKDDWEFATLLNHEVGHVFGLHHAWSADGCEDTPSNANCWSSTGHPPCAGVTSNNMMDYNNSQMAVSPCQIGKMHMNIAKEKSLARGLIVKDWCIKDPIPFEIRDSVEWLGARDINNDIIIKKGGVLKLCCRVSMAENTSITVEAGGTLILEEMKLHNDCGHQWDGIIVQKKGKKTGKVVKIGNVQFLNINKNMSL